MKDMKLSKKERKDDAPVMAGTKGNGPAYPYGLHISFEEDSLKKLGKSVSDFKLGQKMKITAVVEVDSVSDSQSQDGNYSSVGLQIQKIDLGTANRVEKMREGGKPGGVMEE